MAFRFLAMLATLALYGADAYVMAPMKPAVVNHALQVRVHARARSAASAVTLTSVSALPCAQMPAAAVRAPIVEMGRGDKRTKKGACPPYAEAPSARGASETCPLPSRRQA